MAIGCGRVAWSSSGWLGRNGDDDIDRATIGAGIAPWRTSERRATEPRSDIGGDESVELRSVDFLGIDPQHTRLEGARAPPASVL